MKNKPAPLNSDIKLSLKEFFQAVSKLSNNEIIRSSKYSADIAEYICSKYYNLKLCDNQREVDYDATDVNNNKIQIKINNSRKKTNQDIGNKHGYDYLFLLITSDSLLFNKKYETAFITLYKIQSSKISSNKYIAKTFINSLKPDLLLNAEFEAM